MAEATPIIATTTCTLWLTGRLPASGDPVSPAFLRLSLRLKVLAQQFNWTNGLGLGDLPVWVIVEQNGRAYYFPYPLDENAGQFSSARWYEDDVNLSFSTTFKPSAGPIRLTVLHGEWQRGIAGAVGGNVSEADIQNEYRKGTSSELFIAQSAAFRLPNDTSGDDDLYGGTRTWSDRAIATLNGTLQLAVVAGVTAYAFTRAFK